MRTYTFRPRILLSDTAEWMILFSIWVTIQGSLNPSGVVVLGSPSPDKQFKKSAFNELVSRQRISKRRIRNDDYSSLKSSTIYDRKALHGCDIDEYWNSTKAICITCTRCSQEKTKTGKGWTLRGCGFDRDTECGTIGDLQRQLKKLSRKQNGGSVKINIRGRRRKDKHGRNNRSHKSDDENDAGEVYGYFVTPSSPSIDYSNKAVGQEQYGKPQRRKVSVHHKLKEKVRNLSQDRDEFLKQIHEEGGIDLDSYGNYASDDDDLTNYGEVNYDYGYDPDDYDENYYESQGSKSNSEGDSSLHQEIALIKNHLENEPVDYSSSMTTISTNILPKWNGNYHHTIDDDEKKNPNEVDTDTYTYKENWGSPVESTVRNVLEHEIDSHKGETSTNIYYKPTLNVPDFIDSKDTSDDDHSNHGKHPNYNLIQKQKGMTTETGVFGAVVKQPPMFGEITDTLLEPVDILGRWLNKNNSISSKKEISSLNNEDGGSQGLRLEHGLVVVGFVIGFGFVFAVGLLYAKVQRVRRFKLLDNASAHRANSIAHPNDGIGTGSFIEEATCESSLISSRNSSIDSQVQPQQMANFQMKPKSSPNSLLASPIGAPSTNQSDKQQSPSNQKGQQPSLFSKATVIKPKTAAEVAAKTLPIVSQFQQQILSPVSTMTSETSQLQGKQKTLSPNKQSILLTAQEGIADVLRNVGSSPIISSSSSLFGGSSNQSPVGGSTPIQLLNCSTQPPTTSSSLQQSNSQLQHTTYVDQRGRSTLIKPTTPARELPV